MWSSLPLELVTRIAFFAQRDGSALRWCSACHFFRAAQPNVHVLLLGDFASIVSNPLMEGSITSVNVLDELVIILPATCADAAYTRLEALPSQVLDHLTCLFIAAPLRPGNLAIKAFKPLPRLRALHIQNYDVREEDADQITQDAYFSTCNACLEIVQALVWAGQPRDCLSIDVPLGEAEKYAEDGVMKWVWEAGQRKLVKHDPAEDLVRLIGRSCVQTFALNLGCHDPISFRPKMQAILNRWCYELLKPPTLDVYTRHQLQYATTQALGDETDDHISDAE